MIKKKIPALQKRFFNTLLCLLIASYSFGQTNVSGTQTGTWTKANSPYIIQGTISVPSGSTLTIAAGVEVRSINYSDQFYIYGTLIAKGTATDSIRFRGFADPGNSSSTGGGVIKFQSAAGNTASTLQYAVIDNWGDPNYWGNAIDIATSLVSITNSNIRNNRSTAINIETNVLPTLSAIGFSKNDENIQAYPSSVSKINLANTEINLNYENISNSVTIPKQGAGSYYILNSGLNIPDKQTLTIAAGVELRSYYYSDQIIVNGTLIAKGTATDSIRFRGFANSNNSSSTGAGVIKFQSTAGNTASALQYVVVDNWGDPNYWGNAVDISTSLVSISNSSIRNSRSTAINIGTNVLPIISSVSFSKNDENIQAYPSSVGNINLANTEINLNYENIGKAVTIPKQRTGCYYILHGGFNIPDQQTLTIAAGAELRSYYYSDQINVNGTLIAKGTAIDSVRFKGFASPDNSSSTHAGIIRFQSPAGNTASVLQYAVVDNWGDRNYYGTAININGAAAVTISNSSIRNSDYTAVNIESGVSNKVVLTANKVVNSGFAGINLASSAAPQISNIAFSKNAKDIQAYMSSVGGISSLTNTGIYLNGETINQSVSIPKPGTGSYYVLQGNSAVADKITLTIAPGVEIRSMNYTDQLNIAGTLIAKGTATDSIRFRGFADPGNSSSTSGGIIRFQSAAGNTASALQYVVVDNWGDPNYWGNAVDISTSLVSISNSSIRNSGSTAINIGTNVLPTISSVSFSKNDENIQAYPSSVGNINLANTEINLNYENIGKAVTIPKQGTGCYYILHGGFNIPDQQTLTIAAGAELRSYYYSDQINVNGTLIAKGTAIDSVRFKGFASPDNSSSTHAGIIRFQSPAGNTASVLQYAVVDNWGDRNYYGTAININGAAAVTISNSSIRNSDYTAVNIESGVSNKVVLTANKVVNSGFAGINLASSAAPQISNIAFSKNAKDIQAYMSSVGGISSLTNTGIYLNGETINQSVSIPKPGTGSYYVLQGNSAVADKITLTIAPGVEIRSMNYTDQLNIAGTLIAKGTATDSIRFIGFINPNTGYTNGGTLNFNQGSDSSKMQYVVIDRWGDVNYSGVAANIYSSISITNSVIRNSGDLGISLGPSIAPILSNLSFNKNPRPIQAYPSSISKISNLSNAAIYLVNTSTSASSTFAYPGSGSYYVLQGGFTVPANTTLTILPKVEIRSYSYSDIVSVNGTLIAKGTTADSIRFTGFTNPGTGFSRGGALNLNSGSGKSVLQYVTMDRWGDENYNGIAVNLRSSANISNSSIRNSGLYGIYNSSDSAKITNTSIYANKTGFYNAAGKPVLNNCRIYSNTDYGVNNIGADTVDARNSYWGVPSGPLHASLNPNGKGNKVSDKVKFIPWIQQLIQLPQTISLPPIANQFVGDTLRLNATASSGLPVTYSIVTIPATGVATLAGSSIIFPTDTGKVTLTVSQAGDQYNKPAQLVTSFNVARHTQTINFATLPSKKVSDLPFVVKATSTSGLPVKFALISGPATIKLDTVKLTGAGTVIIEASQAGNKIYDKAAAVQQSFTVIPNLPDLSVKAVTANKTIVVPGDSVKVSWVVANEGEAASATDWTENIYLQSPDGTNRTFVGQVAFTSASLLNVNKTIARSFTIVIPAQLNIGDTGVFAVELTPGTTVQEKADANTNNTGIQATSVGVKKMLTLSLSASQVTEGDASGITAVISRTGSLTAALTANISLSNASKFTVPVTVIIPAGQAGISFKVSAPDNNTVDGTIADSLQVTATGFAAVKTNISLLDNDAASLSITNLPTKTTEGETVTFRITTNLAPQAPLIVYLNSGNQKRFPLPPSVTIAKGALFADVTVNLVQNDVPDIAVDAVISAGAADRSPANATIIVNDDDLPNLELVLQTSLVSESAGQYATQATLRRTASSSTTAFTANLSASASNTLILPATISLAAGEAEKTFDIGVIDNSDVDGPRSVTINASVFIASCNCSTPPSSSGSVSAVLGISDNDGPTLALTTPQQTLAEGLANAGYVRFTRNTATAQALTLTLSSSDINEATIPATAVIAAGQTFVDVPITTKDDGIADGSKKVYFQATAPGFATGTVWVLVTDINKPDLQLSAVKLNTASVTAGGLFNYQLSVKNTGSATAPTGVIVWAYLSADDVIDSSDVLLSEDVVSEAIPAGQSRNILNAVKAPAATGQYKVLFWVNPDGALTELLNTNNLSEPVALTVTPEYSATAQVNLTYYTKGTTIPVTGTATAGNGQQAPNKAVEVYVITNGLRRAITATTDATGKFNAQFVPLANEAGHYSVGASFPGLNAVAEQDAFDILGVRINGGNTPQFQVVLNDTLKGVLTIQNLSRQTLTNLTIEDLKMPVGASVRFDKITSLPANSTASIKYSFSGNVLSTGDLFDGGTLKVKSNEGAIQNLDFYYYCQAPNGYLVPDKTSLQTTVSKAKGERQVELKLINKGKGATGRITIKLPDANFISAVTDKTIPSLMPGDTASVILKFIATADLPFNYLVKGNIGAVAENSNSISIPFIFQKVSESNGSAKITATDQFTYYSPGAPNINGAHVKITDYFTGEIYAEGNTDTSGIFNASSLPEGTHRITVEKEKHSAYEGTVVINAGEVKPVIAFLNYQAITFSWNVVPTAVQDQYNVSLETKFETDVPKPVVTIEMPKKMPSLKGNQTFAFNVTLTNHGLITAEKTTLGFPADDPEYEFVTNYEPADLAAHQSIQVPVLMRRRDALIGEYRKNESSIPVESTFAALSHGPQLSIEQEQYNSNDSVDFAKAALGRTSSASGSCQGFVIMAYGYKCNFFTGQWERFEEPYYYENRNCDNRSVLNEDGTLNVSRLGLYGVLYSILSAWGGPVGSPFPKVPCLICPDLKPIDPNNPPKYPEIKNKKESCVDQINDVAGKIFGKDVQFLLEAGEFGVCGGYDIVGAAAGQKVINCFPKITLPEGASDEAERAAKLVDAVRDLADDLTTNEDEKKTSANKKLALFSEQQTLAMSQPSGVFGQLAENIQVSADSYSARSHWAHEYFGDLINSDAMKDLEPLISPYVTSLSDINVNAQADVKLGMTGFEITASQLDLFFSRWNKSLQALRQNIFKPDLQHPDIINWTNVQAYSDSLVIADNFAKSKNFLTVSDMYRQSINSIEKIVDGQKDAVCASVTVQFSQTATLTREAFEGNLNIFNGHPTDAMKQLSVNIQITDENGVPSNSLFDIQTKALTNLSDITGTGLINAQQTGSAKFTFIPTIKAAPIIPKVYTFGGSISYFDPYAKAVVTLPLAAVPITVNPSPNLALHYFMQRNILGDDPLTSPEIEPSVPAELAVLIQNQGYGDAVNMTISSAQPKVVDNQKGLAIDFKLIGSNFQGQPANLGTTDINFHTIPALQSRVGQWYFTSSLLGKFVSYDAKVVHTDSHGNPDLSLINSVKLHELTKSIKLYGDLDDNINDFLVNDIFDVDDVPDIIYFSQGNRTAKVNPAKSGSFSSPVSGPSFINTLTVTAADTGFNYIKLDDPGNHLYNLQSVTRNDGQVIPLDNAWLTYVTLPVSRQPVYENKFQFVDRFSVKTPVTYTVVWKPKNTNVPKVDSIYNVPSLATSTQVKTLKVVFNKRVDATTFNYQDLNLSLQGGANIITPAVTVTQVDTSAFNVDLSGVTTGNGFYNFTVQAAGVKDVYGTNGLAGKQVGWSQFLTVPFVEAFQGIPDSHFAASFDKIQVLFNLPVDAATVTPARFTIKKNGVLQGGTLVIDSIRADKKLFYLSGLKNILTQSGPYDLVVDLPNIQSAAHAAGIQQQSVTLTVDNTGPLVVSIEKSNTGGLDDQNTTAVNIKFNENITGFNTAALQLKRDGIVVPLNINQLSNTDLKTWSVGNLSLLTYPDGNYSLKLTLTSIKDGVGNAGVGSAQVAWTVNHSPSIAITELAVTPDLGNSNIDGITSGLTPTVAFRLNTTAAELKISQADISGEVVLSTMTNVAAGNVSVPVTLLKGGSMTIKVAATDSKGYTTTASKILFVDPIPLSAKWVFSSNQTLPVQVDTIPVIFSSKLGANPAFLSAVQLSRGGTPLSVTGLRFNAVNDTLYNVSGIKSAGISSGSYQLSLNLQLLNKFSSGKAGDGPVSTTWNVRLANVPPIANAGSDIYVTAPGLVTLNGTSSSDSNGDALTYTWTTPEGVILNDTHASSPTFTIAAGDRTDTLSFLLLVSDGQSFATDVVKVNVNISTAVSFIGLQGSYYTNSTPSTLLGSPDGGVFSGHGISGNLFDPSAAGVGAHTITYTLNGKSKSQNTTVSQPPQTPLVFLALPAQNYGNPDFNSGATSGSGTIQYSFSTSGIVTIGTDNNIHILKAGTVTITASDGKTTQQQTLVINPRAVTVMASAQTKVYGDRDPIFTYAVTSGSIAGSDKFTGTLARAAGEGIGSYAIGKGSLSLGSNYTLTFNGASMAITKATLTITAQNQTRYYGAANPGLALSYAGFVNGDVQGSLATQATVTTTATATSSVGSYPITVGGAASPNYNIVFVNGTLSVTPAQLTITAIFRTKVYGTANPALKVTYAGFVNGETQSKFSTQVAISTMATDSSPAGNYPITASGAVSANYDISYVTGNLLVTPAALNITAVNQTKIYGAANPALTASYSGFVNNDTQAALAKLPILTTAATTASGAGTYPIAISGAASSNYTITYTTGTLTVTPAALTITANSMVKTYGAANPMLAVSYAGFVNGDTQAKLSTQAAVSTTATVSSPAGTYPVTATGAASPNYSITFVPSTLTVNPAPLTIAANNQTKTYGLANPVLTLNYTGFVNGDNAAKLTTQPVASTTATVSSNAGSYPITLIGATSANYVITNVPGTLAVTRAALTITAFNQGKTYASVNPVLALSFTGFVNGDTQAKLTTQPVVSTTAVTTSPVGSYPITLSGATSSNYTITHTPGVLTVSQAVLSVTAANQTKTYGAANPALTISYSGFVNGESQTVFTTQPSVTTTAITASVAGTYPITVAGAVAKNYTVNYIAGTLTVNKAVLTITAADQSKVYGAANPALSFNYNGFVNGEMATALTSQPTATTTATAASPVGNYPITGSGASSPNYSITYVAGSLAVTPAPLVITAIFRTKTYGVVNPALKVTYAGFVNGDTQSKFTTQVAINTTAVTESPTGNYPITASGAASSNYAITYVTGNLLVTPATLTITAVNQSKVYGSANPVLLAKYSGFMNGDTVLALTRQPILSTTALPSSVVGNYPIAVSGAVSSNYTISYVAGTLTVNLATLTVTVTNQTRVYGTANPVLTVNYSGFVNGDTEAKITTRPTIVTPATAASAAGSYPINAGGAAVANYMLSYVQGTLVVTPAALTVTAVNQTKTYGAANPVLALSYTGFANGDTPAWLTTQPTVTTTATATSAVGDYPITVGGAVSANYNITYVSGKLTVSPAPLTITAIFRTKVYGTENPALKVTYAGFVNGETQSKFTSQVAITTTATIKSPAGNYPITAAGALSPNYAITYVVGNLLVTPAALTITAVNQTRAYGSVNPVLTAKYNGFLNGDSTLALTTQPVLVTTATTASVVGSYPITVSGATATNYTITYAQGTLMVTPAVLTVTPANQTRVYGAANPVLTISYSGFVNGDTPAKLTAQPTVTTVATTTSTVGDYPITAGGAGLANYTLNYVPGKLSVTPAPLTITAIFRTKVYGTINPALKVTYAGFVNGDTQSKFTTQVAINTTAIIESPAGNYPITASGAVSPNYAINYVDGTLLITPAVVTAAAINQSRMYGTANPALTVKYTGFLNGDTESTLTKLPLVATTATASSAVGNYPISVSGATALNYTFTYVPGVLTVTSAPLAFASIPAKTYGTADFSPGAISDSAIVYSSSNTGVATIVAGKIHIVAAGTSVITAVSKGQTLTQTIMVNPAMLTVTPVNQTKTYGSDNPVFNLSYTGFVNGDTQAKLSTQPSVTTTATITSVVGDYGITASGGTAANYTLSYIAGKLTVAKAPLTITAIFRTKVYGTVNPALKVTYAGFVNGETQSKFSTQVTISTTAVTASPAGNYPITASGAVSTNYEFTYVDGTLLVTKAPLTVTANNQAKVTGSANPVLTVTYAGFINNETQTALTILPVVKTTAATTSPAGSYPITSSGAVAVNYAITYVNGTLLITDSSGLPGQAFYQQENTLVANVSGEPVVKQAMSPNGDGQNDVLFIENIGNYPDNTVTLVDFSGQKVFEISGYDNANRVFDGHSSINGRLQKPGTYYYLLEYRDNGVVKRKKGFFLLKY